MSFSRTLSNTLVKRTISNTTQCTLRNSRLNSILVSTHNNIINTTNTLRQYKRLFSSVSDEDSHDDFKSQRKTTSQHAVDEPQDTDDISVLIKHDIENHPVFLYMKGM